jgi:hypothetical protein
MSAEMLVARATKVRPILPIVCAVSAVLALTLTLSAAASASSRSSAAATAPAITDADPTSANAVIPTSPNPGTNPDVINNYVQVDFPANDDGTWPCGGAGNASPPCPGPEGQTGPTTYPFGFNINFFGSEFSGAYVNNNGNVTFAEPLPTYTPMDLTSFGSPIIAPFFADVDTRVGNIVNFGTGTLNGMKVFVVNWPSVGCFEENDTVTDDFQLVIIDRPDRGTGDLGDDFDMEFNFDSIQWDTGQASGGDSNCINGPAGNSAFVGYSNGTSTAGDSYTVSGSGVPNALLDSNTTTGLIYNDLNSTTLGRYLFTVNNGQPTPPTTTTTSLSGGGQSGVSISVPAGTAVTDSANLSGTNAASATGTVTYDVYSDSGCTTAVSSGSPEDITTPGTLPPSTPVTLSTPGTYYWRAIYSGDSQNNGSNSICGPSGEVETATGSVAPPDLNAVIQVETKSSLAGDTVDISSLALESSCKSVTFETLQGGSVSSPTVMPNSIQVVLDGDGNATVVVNGVRCDPGKDPIEADMPKAPYLSATTTLVVHEPRVTPAGLTGYPADEVETGNTPASGDSDVYTVFYVETSGVYAGQKVEISSPALYDRCGQGSRWESNGTGSPFIDSPNATAIIDNDGNAVFVFKGASCAAGTSVVSADVEAGTHRKFTTKYVIEAPKVTVTTKHPAITVSASPNPLILAGG